MQWQNLTPLFEKFGAFGEKHPLWAPLCVALCMESSKSNADKDSTPLSRDAAWALQKNAPLPAGLKPQTCAASFGMMRALRWITKVTHAETSQIQNKIVFSEDTLRTLYTFVYTEDVLNLSWRKHDEDMAAATEINIGIKAVAAKEIPELTKQFFSWLQSAEMHPAHLAAETLYALLMLCPFNSARKEMAVLGAQFVLCGSGYPFVLLGKNICGPKDALLTAFYKAMESILRKKHPALLRKKPATPASSQSKTKQPTLQDIQKKGNLLKIGTVAKTVGETVPTIRFWTQQGLLKPAAITPAHYALYAQEAVDAALHIQKLKKKRFTLAEIKERIQKTFETS